MGTTLDNRTASFGRRGTFYTKLLAEGESRELARNLAKLHEANSLFSDFGLAVDRMSGKTDNLYQFRTIGFAQNDIEIIGADLNARVQSIAGDTDTSYEFYNIPPDYEGQFKKYVTYMGISENPDECILTPNGRFILVPAYDLKDTSLLYRPLDMRVRYLIPFPREARAYAIVSSRGYLVRGVDFEDFDGGILFYEDPLLLFPTGRIHCQVVYRRNPTWWDYVLRVDEPSGNGQHIFEYYRQKNSVLNFQLATAQACGFQILPWESELKRVDLFQHYTVYEFEHGTIVCDYPHTPETPGIVYPKGYILGTPVFMASKPMGVDTGWHRQFDWSSGLPLDTLTPFKGLTAPDAPCRTYAENETDGNLHAKFELQGAAETQAQFWAHVAQSENRTGKYLNDVIELADVNATKFINPIDFYFQHLLDQRGIVVGLKTKQMGDFWDQRARSFINREKPVGSLIVYRDITGSNLLAPFNISVISYDRDVEFWRDRVQAAGSDVDDSAMGAVDTFCRTTKTGTAPWYQIDDIGLFAGASSLAGALCKLKIAPGSFAACANTNFVSSDYDPTSGLKGNGINKRLNPGYVAATMPPSGNESIGDFITDFDSAAGDTTFSLISGRSHSPIFQNRFLGFVGRKDRTPNIVGLDDSDRDVNTSAQLVPNAFYCAYSSGSSLRKVFRNGTNVLTSTGTFSPRTENNSMPLLFRWNQSNGQHSPCRGTFYFRGRTMTDAQVAQLSTAVTQLMTDLGVSP